MTVSNTQPPSAPARRPVLPIVLGFLFLLPAALACGATQGLLSIGTLVNSLQRSNPFGGTSVPVGMLNYLYLTQDQNFGTAFGFTALTALVRLLAVALVPALLAWGLGQTGRRARWALRLLFTLPVAAFTPVALALMWSLLLRPGGGFLQQPVLGQPTSARLVLLFVDGLYTLGLACAAGLVFALASYRNPDPAKSPRRPLLAAWGIGLLAAAASSLESFSFSYALTNGGPTGTTTSLVLYLFKVGFMRMETNLATAVATLILFLLAVLGLAAGIVIIASGLKISLPGKDEAPAPVERSGAARGALIAALVVSGLAFLVSLVPLLATVAAAVRPGDAQRLQAALPPGQTLVNSLVPALVAALLLQLPFSYLGALGIGAFRPLGRHSEWLLLPFCLWLFTGPAVFAAYAFQLARQMDLLGNLMSLVPPLAVSVPMLVVLTLFFKGQQAGYEKARSSGVSGTRAFFNRLVLPSLPLAGLLVLGGLFATMQDTFWQVIFTTQQTSWTGNVTLLSLGSSLAAGWAVLAKVLLEVSVPGFLFFFLAFGAFQLFYVERLSLAGGRD